MAAPAQPKVVGFHASPQVTITFRDKDGKLEAIVPQEKNPVPVKLPPISPLDNSVDFTLASKVKRLLQNYHLQPTYSIPEGQKTGEVSFIPVEPENKTWEKWDELSLPDKDTPCFFRADGAFCYAFVNTVTTWLWKSSEFVTTAFNTTYITALAGLPDGRLLIGDEKGNLLLQGNPHKYSYGNQNSIINIVAITPTCFLVRYKDKKALIFNILSFKFSSELDFDSDFTVLKNGFFAFLKNKKLKLYQFDESKNIFTENKHSFEEDFLCIKAVSEDTLLLTSTSKDSIIIWNFEKNSVAKHENELLHQKAHKKELIFIDDETFACPERVRILFYNAKNREFKASQEAGNWGVSTLILLTDRSIMYATHTSPSGIHVVTRNGTIAFTDKTLIQNNQVKSLRELADGAVAVRFETRVMIIYPKKKNLESTAYKIEKLLLDLKHNPTQVDLYDELANLYDDNDKRYQTYLAGLEAAVKGNALYQARRYYEKARRVRPDAVEPSHIFSSYLHESTDKKQKSQVALDLFRRRTKSDPSAEPTTRPNKKCKERLFVGEGDFSFTEALLNKHQKTHQKLASSITATELGYLVDNSEEKGPENNTPKRILQLQDKGVKVLFGIDGQFLHHIFKGKRFRRIHWNCPFVDFTTSNKEAFKEVIPKFFVSCSQLQLNQDRVHITLMQEKDGYWRTRQKENPLVKGATLAGYRLIRKRLFGAGRYVGYEHVKTSKAFHGKNEEMREFIFEKAEVAPFFKEATDMQKMAKELENPQEKKYEVNTDSKKPSDTDYYFECSTDEDSSDYYESDPDIVTP